MATATTRPSLIPSHTPPLPDVPPFAPGNPGWENSPKWLRTTVETIVTPSGSRGDGDNDDDDDDGEGLGAAATAGTVVVVVGLVLLIIAFVVFTVYKRRKEVKSRQNQQSIDECAYQTWSNGTQPHPEYNNVEHHNQLPPLPESTTQADHPRSRSHNQNGFRESAQSGDYALPDDSEETRIFKNQYDSIKLNDNNYEYIAVDIPPKTGNESETKTTESSHTLLVEPDNLDGDGDEQASSYYQTLGDAIIDPTIDTKTGAPASVVGHSSSSNGNNKNSIYAKDKIMVDNSLYKKEPADSESENINNNDDKTQTLNDSAQTGPTEKKGDSIYHKDRTMVDNSLYKHNGEAVDSASNNVSTGMTSKSQSGGETSEDNIYHKDRIMVDNSLYRNNVPVDDEHLKECDGINDKPRFTQGNTGDNVYEKDRTMVDNSLYRTEIAAQVENK